ncbi:MAG: hypothetical protein FWG88_06990 [Oscillospiraceae bacterium]|nr:hypothetical protein [Oscillospiraceae bacterium]
MNIEKRAAEYFKLLIMILEMSESQVALFSRYLDRIASSQSPEAHEPEQCQIH